MKNKVKEFVKWLAYIGDVLVGLLFLLVVIGLCVLGMYTIFRHIGLRPADDLPPSGPSEGVAWIMPEAGEVPVWLSPVCTGEAETAVWLDTYTEGDGPAPEWYRPDEEMSAVWRADVTDINVGDINVLCNTQQSDSVDYAVDYIAHPPVGIDPGGVDWNLCTTLWGWDGHGAEVWELDLFAKIFYREFWQPNLTLCEAGCDAMLQLWDLNGGTMFETLSHINEDGSYAFSTFPGVWEAEYDPDGLAWCRAYCEERFYNGPVWIAPFFRTGNYHDWAVPCYEIDGVYFSTGKGW